MKKLVFTKRSKLGYTAAGLEAVIAAGLFIAGFFWLGVVVAGAAFGLAFGVAGACGHLTRRRSQSEGP